MVSFFLIQYKFIQDFRDIQLFISFADLKIKSVIY